MLAGAVIGAAVILLARNAAVEKPSNVEAASRSPGLPLKRLPPQSALSSSVAVSDNDAARETADGTTTGETKFMPAKWEEPFFEIMDKEGQSMQERNARLIEFATTTAAGVPPVQEECLRHLAYGLTSDQKDEFYKLATAPSIPLQLRKRFLDSVFDMGRKDKFIAWLCGSLRSHGDPELIALARSRIANFDEL